MLEYTEKEIEFIKTHYQDMTDTEMAAYLPGRTPDAIATKRKKMKLPRINKERSFKEVVELMNQKGYELISGIEDYVNAAQSTIRYICPKHRDKGEQKISLGHLKENHCCYYCGREVAKAVHREDLDSNKQFYIDLCKEKDFSFVDVRRDNGKVVVDFYCNKHQELGIQTVPKNNFIRNKKCQYCMGRNLPEDYVLNKIHEANPNLKILSKYKSFSGTLKCECLIHHEITNKKPYEIINLNHGCKLCGLEKLSANQTISDNEVEERVHKINPHISLIKYNGAGVLGEWYCNKHQKVFTKTPPQLYNHPSGCNECYREMMQKTQGMGKEEFENRVHKKFPHIKVVGKYVTNSTPIQLYCEKHKCSFSLAPANMLIRKACCTKSKVTYKEEKVCMLLEEWGFKITRQKRMSGCVDKGFLPFDAYLDDYNILVEYQGEQHFYPIRMSKDQTDEDMQWRFEYTKKHDAIKKAYCKKHHIKLIEVPYWEFQDLEYYLFDQLVKCKALIESA